MSEIEIALGRKNCGNPGRGYEICHGMRCEWYSTMQWGSTDQRLKPGILERRE